MKNKPKPPKVQELHDKLCKKYNISDKLVSCIRFEHLTLKRTKEGIISVAESKLKSKKSPVKRKHLKEKISFLTNCSDKEWLDVSKRRL